MAKILISIDHKWRDLPSYVYAGILLERLGHEVYFTRNGLEKYFVAGIRPDMVIFNHLLEKSRQEYANYLNNHGIKVVILPTEGIPTLEGYRDFAAGIENDLSSVSLHFLWNKPMLDITAKNKTISQRKLKVIGVPRFDFYKEPLKRLLISKEQFLTKYNFKNNFPIITFATNFTQAQFHKQNKDFFRTDAKNLGYDKVLEQFGGLNSIPERDYKSRQINVEAFIRLVKDFENINFVLKLHPSEDHYYYYALFENKLKQYRDRVKVIVKEYIWDILNVTDIELKRSCTTGIESWILGKPTIEMRLNSDEWYYSNEHASGSDVVTDYKQLKQIIEYYLNGGTIDEKKISARKQFLENWCYKIDGRSTHRLVDAINSLLHEQRCEVTLPCSLKKNLLYYLLRLTDYKVHDLKVYGLKSILNRAFMDSLGRIDKYFHRKDLLIWRNKLESLLF